MAITCSHMTHLHHTSTPSPESLDQYIPEKTGKERGREREREREKERERASENKP